MRRRIFLRRLRFCFSRRQGIEQLNSLLEIRFGCFQVACVRTKNAAVVIGARQFLLILWRPVVAVRAGLLADARRCRIPLRRLSGHPAGATYAFPPTTASALPLGNCARRLAPDGSPASPDDFVRASQICRWHHDIPQPRLYNSPIDDRCRPTWNVPTLIPWQFLRSWDPASR